MAVCKGQIATGSPEPTEESTAPPTQEAPATATLQPKARPWATSSPIPTSAVQPSLFSTRERFGVGVALPPADQYDVGRLGASWYVNWWVNPNPPRPNGMEFVQMVRVAGGRFVPDMDAIRAAADANPGSLWIIGNEPDVIWQDNATPMEYAQVYHELYTFLKARDPSCKVAIGGISPPQFPYFQSSS